MPKLPVNPQLDVHNKYRIMNIINPHRFDITSQQFRFTIDTTLGDGQSTMTLPLRSGFDYNMLVDYGDGNIKKVESYNDSNVTHNYTISGVYQIKILGTCQAWYFNNSGDKDKITSVDRWGRTGFINMESAFYGCSNLTTMDDPDGEWCSNVTVFGVFARSCSSLTTLDVSNWNTSNVASFANFVQGCSLLTTLDVSNWNTSNATRFDSFVQGCSLLTTLDVSNWNTSNVTNFVNFIRNCQSLTVLNVLNWDTSNVVNFFGFIINTGNEVDLDVSNWIVTGVTNFSFFATNGSLSVTNYDILLNTFAAQSVNSDLSIGMGSSQYSTSGETARNTLITTYNWTISDAGCIDC